MRNIKLVIEYDGSDYVGWQRQPQGPTIQETIENSLGEITGEKLTLYGSGRTDSGVHALGQVANFNTESRVSAEEFQKGLNSILPRDIVILESRDVLPEFHAQFSSQSKVYLYRVLSRSYGSALLRNRVWQVPYRLSPDAMSEAAYGLVGEHDFSAFAQAGAEVKSKVRTVISAEFKNSGDDILEFTIEADGFLKRMVRLIVGTLVQVGKKRLSPSEFADILKSANKNKFVLAAPPHGLYLKEVKY
jgi:tRNA pseudouridine38-40 synthase